MTADVVPIRGTPRLTLVGRSAPPRLRAIVNATCTTFSGNVCTYPDCACVTLPQIVEATVRTVRPEKPPADAITSVRSTLIERFGPGVVDSDVRALNRDELWRELWER